MLSLTACESNKSIKLVNKQFLKKYGESVRILNERQQRKYDEISRMDEKKHVWAEVDNKKMLISRELQQRQYEEYLVETVKNGKAYADASLFPAKYMYEIEARSNPHVASSINQNLKYNTEIECQEDSGECVLNSDLFYSTKNMGYAQDVGQRTDFNKIKVPNQTIQNYRARLNKTMLFAESNEELQASLDFLLVKRYKGDQLRAEEEAIQRQQAEQAQKENGIFRRIAKQGSANQ